MAYEDYLAGETVILTVATTGGIHGKETNPNVPEQPEEIAEQARECERLGASIVHVHGRDEHGENSAAHLQQVTEAVRERCEDIVVQHTTGGQTPYEDRVQGIRTDPLPDMASLDMGPFNRGRHLTTTHTRHNVDRLAREMQEKGIKPELEVFNNGHLNELHDLVDTGVLDPPYYVNLIFGRGTFAIPSPENVMNAVRNLPENSIFNVLATGPHQLPLTTQSVLLGGHVRVGMEDNLYYRRGEPATGNPQLVERSAAVIRSLDRELATPAETRELLGL